MGEIGTMEPKLHQSEEGRERAAQERGGSIMSIYNELDQERNVDGPTVKWRDKWVVLCNYRKNDEITKLSFVKTNRTNHASIGMREYHRNSAQFLIVMS